MLNKYKIAEVSVNDISGNPSFFPKFPQNKELLQYSNNISIFSSAERLLHPLSCNALMNFSSNITP
jgi:hypothetical protein